MKTLKQYINTVRFKTLAGFIIGPIIFIGGSITLVAIRNNPPEYLSYCLLSIMSLSIAISSFFVIKYREAPRPGLPSIKGAWALVIGIINLLLFGFGFILAFYEATVKLLK